MKAGDFALPINAIALLCTLTACGARAHIDARNPALTLAPTCADAVPVYSSSADVPYDYYEVALITAEGNSVYTGNGDVLKSVRKQAASIGANGVVVDSLHRASVGPPLGIGQEHAAHQANVRPRIGCPTAGARK